MAMFTCKGFNFSELNSIKFILFKYPAVWWKYLHRQNALHILQTELLCTLRAAFSVNAPITAWHFWALSEVLSKKATEKTKVRKLCVRSQCVTAVFDFLTHLKICLALQCKRFRNVHGNYSSIQWIKISCSFNFIEIIDLEKKLRQFSCLHKRFSFRFNYLQVL